ncbi:SDR family oxidoreductase [Alcanivorax sp. JB21]|uniref:SDR family oxidoreductase n=1 Tax=Alcanivorax limicola TaxID=2874102 RepID=UPI001CBDA022|nr:SDR family oxidoreductase [Alcanivorax limicola]MBZ2188247.1 SDR family oxidoreductase [Alcanivorax limicola]
MTQSTTRILITGATGQLGRLVIQHLIKTLDPSRIIAGVRNPEKATELSGLGVVVRRFDYAQPDTLDSGLEGVNKLLLISSSEVGQRTGQHKNVIDAALRAKVSLLAYTSILHADTNPMQLAQEHQETEAYLRKSGVPSVILRNGWYTENYAENILPSLDHGALVGAAGDGRIAAAPRADYAEAAVAVLTSTEQQAGRTYELAGDDAFTLSELAEEVSRQSGRPFRYQNLEEAEYAGVLVSLGLPEGLASILADSDVEASRGALFDDGHQLSRLTGRKTTPYQEVVSNVLNQ